jgi:hypothetical protein
MKPTVSEAQISGKIGQPELRCFLARKFAQFRLTDFSRRKCCRECAASLDGWARAT